MQPRPELVGEIISSLAHDLVATLGWTDADARDRVAHGVEMETSLYDERTSDEDDEVTEDDFKVIVVNYVQDWVLELFEDKSWPACPAHPNHPLVMDDGPVWRCPRTRDEVAPLGRLRSAGH